MTLFLTFAAVMLGIALAFPLLPLLRQRSTSAAVTVNDPNRRRALKDALAAGVIDNDEYTAKLSALPSASTPRGGRSRVAVIAALAIAVVLPIGAIVLYQFNGEPGALDPSRMTASNPATAEEHGVDMDQAVSGLVAKLKENPDNPDGWALLGRAYQSMGKFAESRDALKRAYDLKPDSHDLTVEYAQALALSNEGRRIVGESRVMLDGVLKADPDHQRALWLVGISDYQAGDYNGAITVWNRLLPALPPDSEIAESVRTQIADAQKLGGTVAMASDPSPAAASPAEIVDGDSDVKLTVNVSLDAGLKERLASGATLFVFARADNGPPMPLAIHKGPASALPLTVTLDDSMGMMPTMKLSMFPKVVIGARISASGNAMAQSGDLQVLSPAVDVSRKEPVDLVIDSVAP